MSDTPRTEAEVNRQKCWSNDLVTIDANFACQLERELNAANQIAKKYEDRYFASLDRIKRLEEFVDQLTNPKFTRDDLPKEALLQRIQRLEESGDAMAAWLSDPRNLGDDPFMSSQWRKVKEAKP